MLVYLPRNVEAMFPGLLLVYSLSKDVLLTYVGSTRHAGNVEANYIQHVAENKGSKINIGLSPGLLWSCCYTKPLRVWCWVE